MTWNFRLVRNADPQPNLPSYGVHEVFYNDVGQPCGMTERAVDITGQSQKEVREYLRAHFKTDPSEVNWPCSPATQGGSRWPGHCWMMSYGK